MNTDLRANEAFLAEVLADQPRFPAGSVFIDVASARSETALLDAIYEERAIVLIFPNGRKRALKLQQGRFRRMALRVFWPLRYPRLLREIKAALEPVRDTRRQEGRTRSEIRKSRSPKIAAKELQRVGYVPVPQSKLERRGHQHHHAPA